VTQDSMKLKLTWTDNTTNEYGFKVERKIGTTGTYAEIGSVVGINSVTPSVGVYTDSSVQTGVMYYYRVRAYATAGGYTGYSNEAAGVQASTVAPSGLVVTADWTSLKLTWTDNTTNESGYKIERKLGASGTYVEIGTTNLSFYTDTTGQVGVTYYYRVRAYTTDGGYTGYSNEASGASLAAPVPSGLVVAIDGMKLQLTWTDNTTNESGFNVERKTGATGTYAEIATVTGSNATTPRQATYTDATVQPGLTYYYRVRGYSTTGAHTGYSNEASGTQATTVVPSGLTVTTDGMDLKLTWTDNTTNDNGFKIERKDGAAGTYTEIKTTAATVYTDLTVQPGVTYYYRVRAYTTAGGYTAYSNEASGMQASGIAPSGLTVTVVNMSLKLTWKDNTTNEYAFKVERKTGATGTYAEIGIAAAPSYTDLTVQPQITYYYRVRAYTTPGGYTGYSNEASGVQPVVVPAPSGLAVTTSGMSLKLTWTNNGTNLTGWAVERKIGATGAYVEITKTSPSGTTTYSDETVQPGIPYYYRVRGFHTEMVGGVSTIVWYTGYSNEAGGVQAATVAPSGLVAKSVGLALTLTWTNNAQEASGVAIERKVGAGGAYAEIGKAPRTPMSCTNLGCSGGDLVTSYDDKTVQSGVVYYYRARAYTMVGGYTAYSNEASGMQASGVAPSGLTVTSTGVALRLTWTNNASNADGIAIERKVGAGGAYAEIGRAPRSPSGCDSVTCYVGTLPTLYDDTTVQSGTTYYYRVRAYATAGGYTAYSNEAGGTK
jgi:fibronectin type 3 domain-containing protein